MSVAYYIVLDSDEANFDSFVDGKAVAHAIEDLNAICEHTGLPILESFVGQSIDDLEDMLGEDIELPEGESGEHVWHTAEAGITYIDALMAAIRNSQHDLAALDDVLEDLQEYKNVLEQAKEADMKWHLALDI
ncbi:hypothetical protein [Undibacterium sp. TJN19]|uniref:hypothetical protein n=1 Tax=Undibacterium sp. TJN19 TaxID=3413055 RepID=UPI003BF0FE0E